MPVNGDTCRVCSKKCNYLEINRQLKQDVQVYFRSPNDLAVHYAQKLKTVMDFQNFQRTSYQKHQQEKFNKAMKYVRAAQTEIAKRTESERMLLKERNQYKAEVDNQNERIRSLETTVAQQEREMQHMKHKLGNQKSPAKSGRFPSLNGATPINTLSFLDCCTSTPIGNLEIFDNSIGPIQGGGGNKPKDIFAAGSPGGFDSPIAGGGFLNTPMMLGISNKEEARLSSKTPGRFF